MKLQTKYIGEVEVSKEKVIQFPVGLPGFEKETQFALLDLPGNPIFQTLQSVKTSNLAFVVTNPYHIYSGYEFKLDKNIQESLHIKQKQDVHVLTIVTLKSPFDTSTLNLKAPIIINDEQKIGKQYILVDEDYPTKAALTVQANAEGE